MVKMVSSFSLLILVGLMENLCNQKVVEIHVHFMAFWVDLINFYSLQLDRKGIYILSILQIYY